MIDNETSLLNSQIRVMWTEFALLPHKPVDDIDSLRQSITDRIQFQRRVAWWNRCEKANNRAESAKSDPWYRKWIMGEQTDVPEIDDEDFKLDQESAPHVILEVIDKSVQNELLKHADDYIGLELQPSMHRVYPFGSIACHVIGHLGKVNHEDIKADPFFGDDLHGYSPIDPIGRSGLETPGEPTLRGVAVRCDGRRYRKFIGSTAASLGGDLRTTIDIELQQQIQELFEHVEVPYDTTVIPNKCDTLPMHGAAVVIDIASGEVLSMVSVPGYDLNEMA